MTFVVMNATSGIRGGLSRGSVTTGVTYRSNVRRYVRAVNSLHSGGTRRGCLGNLRGGVETIRAELVGSRLNATMFIMSTDLMLHLNVTAATLANACLLAGNRLSVVAFFVFLLIISHLCRPLRNSLRGLTNVVTAGSGVRHVGRVLSCSVRANDSGLAGGKCSVRFSSMKFSCGDGRAILHSISFTTGRNRMATLMKPSNKKGAAISHLTAEF